MAVVLTDIQIAFAAGALFVDAAAPVIEAARERGEAALEKVYNRYMLRALVYAGVFLGPVATISCGPRSSEPAGPCAGAALGADVDAMGEAAAALVAAAAAPRQEGSAA